MQHRHLLPDEIDQLLDGETGFGIAPLEAHVRECEQCRAELEAERQVVAAVEELPRLAPSPLFADHVVAQVNVYEPWDVAVRDAAAGWVQRFVPQSRPLRTLAGPAHSPSAWHCRSHASGSARTSKAFFSSAPSLVPACVMRSSSSSA